MSARVPLPLSIDHPTPVRLQAVFGSGYGTIAVLRDGQRVEAPVAYGAIVPIPDYQVLLERAAAQYLPVGGVVQVQASATGQGAFDELPVIEVFIAADRTFGEFAVAEGWALPAAALLAGHARRQQYVQALSAARSHRAGIWHEATAGELGLSDDLDRLTAPAQAGRPDWVSHLALAAVLVVLLLLGWRERYWRARVVPPNAERGLLRRFLGMYVGTDPGFGKPLPAGGDVSPAVRPPAATPATAVSPMAMPSSDRH